MTSDNIKKKSPPEFSKWPIWDEDEIEAVTNVVKSGQWWCGAPENRAGEEVWKFNKEFAKFQEVNHAWLCTNGTHAIEICIMALGIGQGDEIIVSDWTFVASGSAIVSVGAVPIFCDIDPETYLIDPNKIERLITGRTKAILAVHLGGIPCEMDKIVEIAKKYNIKVIEDCAHAHGSKYKGKMMGSWGDCGTFSFQASKVLNAGEGGLIVVNDDTLSERIYQVLDSGRLPGKWFYDHFCYGSDFRLGEFNAAILRTQLKKYPEQLAKRNKNAIYLNKELAKIPGVHPQKRGEGVESCGQYVYVVYYEPEQFGNIGYKKIYEELDSYGIITDATYPPLHNLDLFKNLDLMPNVDYSQANWYKLDEDPDKRAKHFNVVEKVFASSFQLDQRVLLSDQPAIDYVVDVMKELHKKYNQ